MRIFINSRGFTLIELLAVIVLLGLGIGVSLTVDFTSSPQQQKQHTLQLANALELAAQESVLDGKVLGLDFFTSPDQRVGYRWLQLDEAAWQAYALPDAAAEVLLPAELSMSLSLAGQDLAPEPRMDLATASAFSPEIWLLPTRELTPFTLSVAGTADAASVLTADLMGRIRVDTDAPSPP
jgi:prepilin-type N-terminal cleavage/methylation domain-containing protein